MGIIDYVKRKLSRDEPSYNVIVSKPPSAKVYEENFIGPIEPLAQRSSSSGTNVISNDPSYPRTQGLTTGGGGGSSGSPSISTPTPTPTPAPTRSELININPIQTPTNTTTQENLRFNNLQNQINQRREEMLRRGGNQTSGTYHDVKTGNEQIVTRTTKGSQTIQEVYTPSTGETKIRTYGAGAGGGGVNLTGGYDVKTTPIKTEDKEFVGNNVIFNDVPAGEVQPAPSQFQMWKDYTSEKGYITGTLDYGIGFLTSKHDYYQQKAGYYGGLKETELMGSALRIAPYFSPGGGYILAGEGVEGLMSREGKGDIKERYTSLTDKGFSPGFAGGLSVLPNVAMIGLGVAGSPLGSSIAKNIPKGEIPKLGDVSIVNKRASVQVSKSEYVYDALKQRFVKKEKLVEYLESPVVSGRNVKFIGSGAGDYSVKANRIKDLLSRATTNEEKVAIMKLAEQSYGKEFVKDFTSQELGVISTIKPVENSIIKSSTKQNQNWISSVSTQDKFQLFSNPQNQYSDQTIKQDVKQISEQRTINLMEINTKQKSGSITKQAIKQDSIQDSLSKSALKVATISLLDSKTNQKLRTQQKTDSVTDWLRRRPGEKKPRKPIPPKIKLPSLSKRILKRVEDKDPEVFSIYGRRFGEDYLIKKTTSKKKAEKVLDKWMKSSLGASGFLSQDGKKIKASELDIFKSSSYRGSKKDPFRLVERKEKRLSSGSERKEINYFGKKARKKKNMFGL